jgi:solute carrier family 35, member F5
MSSSDERSWALGIFFIVLVAALWAGSSVMIQYIYDNLNYEEPFVLTYIGTSLFFVYIPGWFVMSWLGLVKNPKFRQFPYSNFEECWDTQYEMVSLDDNMIDSVTNGSLYEQHVEGEGGGVSSGHAYTRADGDIVDRSVNRSSVDSRKSGLSGMSDEINDLISPMHQHLSLGDKSVENHTVPTTTNGVDDDEVYSPPTHVMSHLGTMRVSLIVCPLWFLANWTYNQSLSMTSVTSSTIISTTSSLFSFILSVIFTGEKFTVLKLCGVLFCMGGTVMITLSDGDDGSKPTHEFLGDLVALFSSVAYSAYTVVIKRFVPNDDVIAMPLLLGYLGLFNVILLAPLLALLTITSGGGIFNNFSPKVFGLICVEGLFDDVLSDYLWARAVVLTTPTIATVGLSLTIPLAFITDAMFNGIYPTAMSALGALAVVGGFVLVNVGDGSCETRCKYLLKKTGKFFKKCCS